MTPTWSDDTDSQLVLLAKPSLFEKQVSDPAALPYVGKRDISEGTSEVYLHC